jgi:hypothetical protein
MGNYAGNNVWNDNIYQYDVTDPVIGGPTGKANKPSQDLADRTAWLKDNLGLVNHFDDEVILTGNAPIDRTLAGNLIVVYAGAGNVVLTLDDPHNFRHGAIVPFSAFCVPGYAVTIFGNGFSILNPVDGAIPSMYMHHNETLVLVALTDHWKVAPGTRGNFFCVGEEVKARKTLSNCLAMKGQLVDRAAYPRLWAYVQSLTFFQEVIDEISWWNYGLTYKGLFTTGDGVSNFRLPDERGMFERMLDLGRGLDAGRLHNFAGGYEPDQVGAHDHVITGLPLKTPDTDRGGGSSKFSIDNVDDTRRTNTAGGDETRGKNVAKINQIKF